MEATERAQTPAGHWWKEPERVAEYIERWDREAEDTKRIFDVLTSIIPHDRQAAIRVLDVGSGHGVVAAAVLDAFPNATAVGLDISEAMMEEGSERMKRFGSRFRYQVGDFADGVLPDELGTFDVVVSSRAIHHLTGDGKKSLFTSIYEHLDNGGCFLDIDNMRPRDDFMRGRYSYAADPNAAPRPPRPADAPPRQGGGREFPEPVENQLDYLTAAGFPHVDCVWKSLGRALIGGFKE